MSFCGTAALLVWGFGAAHAAVLFVDNTAPDGGDCRQISPCNRLLEAERQSAPGDIIFVFAGDGTTLGLDRGIRLKSGQSLIGEAAGLDVANAPRVEVGFTPSISSPDGAGVTLADGTRVRGIDIIETGGPGIVGGGVRDVMIERVGITASGGSGVRLSDCAGAVDLAEVQISKPGGSGVFIHVGNTTEASVHLKKCVIGGAASAGVHGAAEGSATLEVTIEESEILGGNIAVDLNTEGGAALRFFVEDNHFSKTAGSVINVFQGQGSKSSSTLFGRIAHNRLVKATGSGHGMRINCNGDGRAELEITANTIEQGISFDYGIFAQARLGGVGLGLRIHDNTVFVEPTALDAIHVEARDDAVVSADLKHNTARAGDAGNGISLVQSGSGRLCLSGLTTMTSDGTQLARVVSTANPAAGEPAITTEKAVWPSTDAECGMYTYEQERVGK